VGNRKVEVKTNIFILIFGSDLGTNCIFFKQPFHRHRVDDNLNYMHQLKKSELVILPIV